MFLKEKVGSRDVSPVSERELIVHVAIGPTGSIST